MKIGAFDTSQRVLVVAEIGNNHEGRLDTAKTLVRKAAEAGAHAVKFQTFKTKYFVSARDAARYQRLASFELSPAAFTELHALAQSLNLLFLSTPLDLESAEFLAGLVDAFKIASGDNNFYPLMEAICATGKPLIVSSGLSNLAHVEAIKRFVEAQWRQRGITQELAVLHCVSSYPVPPEQANLAAIRCLIEALGSTTVGYSDHTVGIEACVAAVALGARIIEKHFTLDHHFSDFRDHQLSATPEELAALVRAAASVAAMVGEPRKIVQAVEAGGVSAMRRSIVAAADLQAGHRLQRRDLTWIRPGGGLPPGEEGQLVGRTLRRAYAFGEPLSLADVE